MGITNRTTGDIVNAIAMKINGVNADAVHRPFKSEILNAVNMAENAIIIDKPQYDFLRKTAVINGYEKGTGQTVMQMQSAAGVISGYGSIPDQIPGAVTYIATKYTAPAGQVFTPASVRFKIDTYASAGKLNGQFDAFVCLSVTKNTLDHTQDPAETLNMPDLQNIIATSNTINVVDDLFDAASLVAHNPLVDMYMEEGVTLTFATPAPVSNGATYWVVIRWISQWNSGIVSPNVNGRDWQFNVRGNSGHTNTSLTWSGTAYPAVSNFLTGWDWNIVLTLDNCVFISSNISLPLDCNLALRIGQPFNGSMGGLFLLPVGMDAVIYKQFRVPAGTFSINGEDPVTGAKLVTLNTAVTIPTIGVPVTYPVITLAAQYYVDYIANGGNLVNDSDISVIPAEYRDLLVYKGMDLLYKLNAGLPESPGSNADDFAYMLSKMNAKCMPQHSVNISVNTQGHTSAMSTTRDTTLSQSLLQMNFPNTWSTTFASGQNIGQQGGF